MAAPALNQLYEALHDYNLKGHSYSILHMGSNRYGIQDGENRLIVIGNISFLLGYFKGLNDSKRYSK